MKSSDNGDLSWEENANILNKIKKNVKKVLKYFLCVIYFSSTAFIPIFVFGVTYSKKGSKLYAIAISFVSFVIMDIICSIAEYLARSVTEKIAKIKEKQLNKRETEKKKIENLLLQKKDYRAEIELARDEYIKFDEYIKNTNQLPKKVMKKLKEVLINMLEILDILEKYPDEYYPLRHTFKVYFPGFQKVTYKFIDISKENDLDDETKFIELVTEFNQYLEYIKSSINKQDKANLNIGIQSLIKVLESERKKGES